jgi:hypothetical protein
MMKNLGIPVDGDDDRNDDSQNNNKDFYFFVDEIYLNCKNLGIPPDTIPSWIKDLLDCYNLDKTSQQSLSRSLGEHDDNHNDGEKDRSPLTIGEQENLTHGKTRSGSIEIRKTDSFNKDSSNHFETDQSAFSPNNVEIPFISRISNFIATKKKECVKLYRHRLALTDEVKGLKLQKGKATDDLNNIIKRERHAIYFIEWFYKLKEKLWNGNSIRIEDIDNFAKVINDFKNHRYDAYEIINEYNSVQSVREEVIIKGGRVNDLQWEEQKLNDKIAALGPQLDYQTQIVNTCSELTGMNLGLKELKLLMSTITEIAQANNIPYYKAVSKFFRDIEEQYDKKLGFENKISEKVLELGNINNNISNSQFRLLFYSSIVPMLTNLLQNGLTEEDIVNINSICLSNVNKIKVNSKAENEQNMNKTECWRLLKEDLKKYGEISLAAREKSKEVEEMDKEIHNLNKQKQELTNYCKKANSIVNNLNSKISYLKGSIDYLGNELSNKIKAFPRLPPLFIFFMDNNSEKNGEGKDEEI